MAMARICKTIAAERIYTCRAMCANPSGKVWNDAISRAAWIKGASECETMSGKK